MQSEITVRNEVSQKEKDATGYHLHVGYGTDEPACETETDSQGTDFSQWGEGAGDGWTGSLGLMNANYPI